ncbi:MFS transporter [Paenibacillus sediminis]|uniref:MFS family permease n=1 Tax=Paenibacillus sediminis TaxID=664909 RepID=A0ABS4H0Z7_9BACL|nr:MFS family permease [Paenibacillus sediminis]
MERLWTKQFILMTLGNLFLFNAFYMLYPTLPPFIKQMGGNESQVGLAMGAFMLSAVIFRPLVGGLLDRFGRRSFIVWGLLLFILAMYMYDWVGGIFVLMGLRILHGMSWAVSTTATITAITDIIPSTRRGEGMGWFSTSMTLAMAIGPMFGIWVTQNLSYSALFLFAVVLSTAALLLMLGAKMPFRPQTGARRIELFEKSVLPVAASVFFLFIAYGGITTFVPLLADSIQVNPGAFFLAFAATLALSRPISGKLSDRYGEVFVIVPALVITICALIVLSLSTGLIGVLVSAVLYGIGFGSAQPALQAATIRLARSDRKGVANASMSTANDLGIGLGAIMLGWVSQYTSYQVLFAVSAVSVAFSLILFTFFAKRLLKTKQSLNADSLPFESS